MRENIVSYDKIKNKLLILDEDLSYVWNSRAERISRRRGGIDIVEADGGAIIIDNFGFPMRKIETEAVIEMLKNGLDNYPDEEEHSDIIEEVNHINEMYREANTSSPEKKEKKIGHVYVLKGENGRCKIGTSKNPEKRVETLCLSSCEHHTLLFSYMVEDPYQHEKITHEAMGHRRKHSEWFELNDEDLEMIETYLSSACIENGE